MWTQALFGGDLALTSGAPPVKGRLVPQPGGRGCDPGTAPQVTSAPCRPRVPVFSALLSGPPFLRAVWTGKGKCPPNGPSTQELCRPAQPGRAQEWVQPGPGPFTGGCSWAGWRDWAGAAGAGQVTGVAGAAVPGASSPGQGCWGSSVPGGAHQGGPSTLHGPLPAALRPLWFPQAESAARDSEPPWTCHESKHASLSSAGSAVRHQRRWSRGLCIRLPTDEASKPRCLWPTAPPGRVGMKEAP